MTQIQHPWHPASILQCYIKKTQYYIISLAQNAMITVD